MDEYSAELSEQSQHYRQAYLVPFMEMVPELGRFLKDFLSAESRRYCERIAESMPDWELALGEAILGGDKQGFRFPSDAHQLFLAHAWILDTPPVELEKRLDVPWCETGDLFYVSKLCALIHAYAATKLR